MTTTTCDTAPGETIWARIKAAAAFLMTHMMAAREQEARRHIAAYLGTLDEDTLKAHGLARAPRQESGRMLLGL